MKPDLNLSANYTSNGLGGVSLDTIPPGGTLSLENNTTGAVVVTLGPGPDGNGRLLIKVERGR